MDAATLATVLLAVVAAVGLIGGGVAWFYKRGGQERESTLAIRDNTKATNALTGRFDSFMERTQTVQELTAAKLADHETRITLNTRDIKHLQSKDGA